MGIPFQVDALSLTMLRVCHRQRQITKRGARKELGGGLSTHEIADTATFDLVLLLLI